MTIEVLNITPAPGEIQRDTLLEFDIRTSDQDPFVRVIVAIGFPGSNVVELAYAQNPTAGGAFEDFYTTHSSVMPVSEAGFVRFHFGLRRQANDVGVWPDSPRLIIYGFNAAGEEV